MEQPRTAIIVCIYGAMLLFTAVVRFSTGSDLPLAVLAPYATVLYIGAVVFALNTFPRFGVSVDRFGFTRPRLQHLALGLMGVAAVLVLSWALEPLWAQLFNDTRDLSRFDAVAGSTRELAKLLALSWTFAAFGEELAFRILLLQGLIALLGRKPSGILTALIVQAAVFGMVHSYQGGVGIAETFVSGLIYGTITVLGRGAIWPAAIAHGLGNTVGLMRLYQG